MLCHVVSIGKKLFFMGSEIGQFREWDHEGQVEWFLLDYDAHAKFQHYVSELNHLYLEQAPLWECDDSWAGFEWIDADNREQSILSYRRKDEAGRELTVVLNFTPVVREDFCLGVSESGIYEEIFSSDEERFGGSGVINTGELVTTAEPFGGCAHSIRLRIPPLGMTVIRRKQMAKNQKTTDR